MPSWNIHIAHVERLLSSPRWDSWGIADANAFAFGNVVPDTYVGYMVKDATKKIEYAETHLSEAHFIPTPDASAFYTRYVAGSVATELTLGAWCHLLCDHYYNLRTIEFIDRVGVTPSERTRIRKQGDFDLFGRSLEIALVPVVDAELEAQCAAFPQYPVDAPDVCATDAVIAAIVDNNAQNHVSSPSYSLLTKEFFDETSAEVDRVLREALTLHAAGRDASHLGRPRA